MGAEFTIDELARESGMTVRSLRAYQERGLLPPPRLKGRTGFYGPQHLNRVRIISRLMDRGIKLSGIRELLDAWDRGDDLGAVLGVSLDAGGGPGTEAAAPPQPPGEKTIAATELVERYRDVPNGLARVVAAGLYEPFDATTYRERDPQLVRFADQLAASGVQHPTSSTSSSGCAPTATTSRGASWTCSSTPPPRPSAAPTAPHTTSPSSPSSSPQPAGFPAGYPPSWSTSSSAGTSSTSPGNSTIRAPTGPSPRAGAEFRATCGGLSPRVGAEFRAADGLGSASGWASNSAQPKGGRLFGCGL
ncbi:MerR family transcriptional regulator [Nocardia blacklockiae]|uniref:MerR family transcriptional regulator n=1 Tax=Nocardia blacklockiae TaxID=480036 RepID=UPI001E30EC59|nr:MerR family transcriptional regulator [Nocardia blacklockiae]